MNGDYIYQYAWRRPTSVFFGVGFAAFSVLAFQTDAPWYVRLTLVMVTALFVVLLIRNPQSGMILTATQVTFSPTRRPVTYDLDTIDHFVLMDRSDSDLADIVLRDGSRHRLSRAHHPALDVLDAELRARGVAVIRR